MPASQRVLSNFGQIRRLSSSQFKLRQQLQRTPGPRVGEKIVHPKRAKFSLKFSFSKFTPHFSSSDPNISVNRDHWDIVSFSNLTLT